MSGPVFSQFVDRIIERIDRVVATERELKSEDFKRTAKLAERLADGILVGSCANETAVNECLSQNDVASWPPVGVGNSSTAGKPNREAFDKLKPLIQEIRTTPWEIINAGWLHKIQVIHNEAFKLLYGRDGSLLDKIDEFDARLQASDDVLLKSIEVAQIHKAFERQKR